MFYGFLADLIAAFHLGYVLFVIVGLLLILVGAACRWRWIRNPWFRLPHMAAIAVVALEQVVGLKCPLTDWETDLRDLADPRRVVWRKVELPFPVLGASTVGLLGSPMGQGPVLAATALGRNKKPEESFVARLVFAIMFVELEHDDPILQFSYYGVAFAVLATLVLIPPRFRRPRPGDPSPLQEPLVLGGEKKSAN